jgi:hypothetical protein
MAGSRERHQATSMALYPVIVRLDQQQLVSGG